MIFLFQSGRAAQFAIVAHCLPVLCSFAHWSSASLLLPQAALGFDSPLPLEKDGSLCDNYEGAN